MTVVVYGPLSRPDTDCIGSRVHTARPGRRNRGWVSVSLDIGDAISNGVDSVTDRNGLVLFGVFAAFGLVNTVVGQSLLTAYFEFLRGSFESMPPGTGMGGSPFPFAPGSQPTPLALPLPLSVSALLVFVLAVLSEALRIVGIRVVASDERETIPAAATERLGRTTLTAVLAAIVVNVAVGIGTVALLLPGLFLAVSFYFVRPAIALEGVGVVDALSRAWELASGNRVDLFLLLVLVWFVSLLASIPSTVVTLVSPLAGSLVGVVVNAAVLVFGIAVATDAFLQIRDAEESGVGAVSADSEFFEESEDL
ncbi:hypothetical protein [Haloarcula pelagica]|uniref:hypothetical protein n=1 Tax=Halomicroarcula sp. GCM10025709 TaxID=3252669 RepID=UPI0036D31E03